jgi:hypothetical protein
MSQWRTGDDWKRSHFVIDGDDFSHALCGQAPCMGWTMRDASALPRCKNCEAKAALLAPKKNPHAQALGRMAKGVPKNYTKAERKRRGERAKKLAALRQLSKPKK